MSYGGRSFAVALSPRIKTVASVPATRAAPVHALPAPVDPFPCRPLPEPKPSHPSPPRALPSRILAASPEKLPATVRIARQPPVLAAAACSPPQVPPVARYSLRVFAVLQYQIPSLCNQPRRFAALPPQSLRNRAPKPRSPE